MDSSLLNSSCKLNPFAYVWPFICIFTQHGVPMLWHIVLTYFIGWNNIPLHRYCLCIHQRMDVWVVCIFWLLWIMLLYICVSFAPMNMRFQFSWVYLGLGLQSHMANSMFKFLRNCQIFFFCEGLYHFTFPPEMFEGVYNFSTYLSTLVIVCVLDFSLEVHGDLSRVYIYIPNHYRPDILFFCSCLLYLLWRNA